MGKGRRGADMGTMEIVLKTEDARHCLDEVMHNFNELKAHGLMDEETYTKLKRGVIRLRLLVDCYVEHGKA